MEYATVPEVKMKDLSVLLKLLPLLLLSVDLMTSNARIQVVSVTLLYAMVSLTVRMEKMKHLIVRQRLLTLNPNLNVEQMSSFVLICHVFQLLKFATELKIVDMAKMKVNSVLPTLLFLVTLNAC
jgi:hypothetical protein